jgi:hypothetical protein
MAKKKLFKIEVSENRKGVVIWGNRDAFRDTNRLLYDCWGDADGMSDEEGITYLGVMSFFSYEMRHTSLGDRLVKFDGKPLEEWNDELFNLFETENSRFEVGLEIELAYIIFVLASWFECYRNRNCPQEALSILREMRDGVERAIKKASSTNYPRLKPFLYGALYAADPYLMHTMDYIHVTLKYAWSRYMMELAEAMQATIYNSPEFNKLHKKLEDSAAELKCAVHQLTFADDDDKY